MGHEVLNTERLSPQIPALGGLRTVVRDILGSLVRSRIVDFHILIYFLISGLPLELLVVILVWVSGTCTLPFLGIASGI